MKDETIDIQIALIPYYPKNIDEFDDFQKVAIEILFERLLKFDNSQLNATNSAINDISEKTQVNELYAGLQKLRQLIAIKSAEKSADSAEKSADSADEKEVGIRLELMAEGTSFIFRVFQRWDLNKEHSSAGA